MVSPDARAALTMSSVPCTDDKYALISSRHRSKLRRCVELNRRNIIEARRRRCYTNASFDALAMRAIR